MTALSESCYLTSIHNILSWPILTFLLFSRIGKPVLDTVHAASRNLFCQEGVHVGWVNVSQAEVFGGESVREGGRVTDGAAVSEVLAWRRAMCQALGLYGVMTLYKR